MLFSIGLNHKALNESVGCKVTTYSICYQVYIPFLGWTNGATLVSMFLLVGNEFNADVRKCRRITLHEVLTERPARENGSSLRAS